MATIDSKAPAQGLPFLAGAVAAELVDVDVILIHGDQTAAPSVTTAL